MGRKKHQIRRFFYDREAAKVKRLEQELLVQKQVNQEVIQFFFGMSHDIRTPINAMLGLTDIALEHSDNPEKVQECLTKLKNSGMYLLNLVNEIMDVGKMNSGTMVIHEESFCLSEFMEELLAIYRPQFLTCGQELLYCETDVVSQHLIGDKLKLSRLFGNLLGNANKFTPAGGRIRTSVRQLEADREGYARFEFVIEDNGHGMSGDFLERLFEPFARENKASVQQKEGTGFGMAVVKRIVELLEGSIEVESEPECGTVFRILLQFQIDQSHVDSEITNASLAEERQTEPFCMQEREVAATRENAVKGRVLFADDNFINQEIGREQLQKLGYEAEVAASGAEVLNKLEHAQEQPYGLILLDLHMPVMSGCEVARQIRQMDKPWCQQIPIFAVTASTLPEELAETVESGMNGYLQKPINLTQLKRVLGLCEDKA